MINLLTYNVPHRKTYDVLCLLKAKGYKNISVYAKPFSYKKTYKPLIEHRPIMIYQNIDYIKNFAEKYIEIKDYSEIVAGKNEIFLICGATFLPDSFIETYKIINSHPGYIPQMRGLDSFKWAIYEDLPIGVSTHIINKNYIDTGEIIERKIVDVYKNDTFHAVAYRQYELEILMLVNAISKINEQHEFIKPDLKEVRKRMPNNIEESLIEKFETYKNKWGK